MEDFNLNKPRYAALHWDGAMFKDVTGTLQEHESILVSGAPHYIEGKILSVTKLTDEDGGPTSTGEAQASAVLQQIQDWQVDTNIVAFEYRNGANMCSRIFAEFSIRPLARKRKRLLQTLDVASAEMT